MKDKMILAKDRYYSMDCYETQLNNNVLVVGAAGTGKTRSIVSPNILQATGSYVISDPKGNLHAKYGKYLEDRGYVVKKLDFTNPTKSAGYNFFRYIRDESDIVKIAHMLIYQKNSMYNTRDPFWDEAGTLLLQAVMAYLWEARPKHEQTLRSMLKLVNACDVVEENASVKTALDRIMEEWGRGYKDSFAVQQYRKFRVAASRTLMSIMITVNARVGRFDTPEMDKLLSKDTIDIASIGKKKTALFVVVSDTDRSMDGLVNLFFTQAMNELCRYADEKCTNNCLPVPVRFIMDDFATNCTIEDFPRMIASFRSRGISTMLMIQAESQLKQRFGYDDRTIIGNCDTYVYMGGNDVDTAQQVALRCNMPLNRILEMPIGMNWIFRRGESPVFSQNFVLEDYTKELLRSDAMIERDIAI